MPFTALRRWPAGPYLVYSLADGRLLGSTGLAFELEGTLRRYSEFPNLKPGFAEDVVSYAWVNRPVAQQWPVSK